MKQIFFLVVLGWNMVFSNGSFFKVHEWGTFTTLSTSRGEQLEGLFVDATALPDFVYTLPSFPLKNEIEAKVQNATVKLETPVLYFYHQSSLDVEVEVGFRGGSIHQWYPQRSDGEEDPDGIPILTPSDSGSISWDISVLPSYLQNSYTWPNQQVTSEWRSPRHTQSNLVENNVGEIEKYLFYRGLGNFELPLRVRFLNENQFEITNSGNFDLPYVMVYEKPWDGTSSIKGHIWWEGGLPAGSQITLPVHPILYTSQDSIYDSQLEQNLRVQIEKEGLYPDEANAMLATWRDSYFNNEKGFKVFWTVPRALIDSTLPLNISPAPDSLERVLVGRSDILTPRFERKLLELFAQNKLDSLSGDKYYQAYIDLIDNHQSSIGTSGRMTITRPAKGRPENDFSILGLPGKNEKPGVYLNGKF